MGKVGTQHPSASLVSHIDYSEGFQAPADLEMSGQRVLVLAIFIFGIVAFVYGVSEYHWYVPELNAIFLGIGLLAAIVARLPAGETSLHRRCRGDDASRATGRICPDD